MSKRPDKFSLLCSRIGSTKRHLEVDGLLDVKLSNEADGVSTDLMFTFNYNACCRAHAVIIQAHESRHLLNLQGVFFDSNAGKSYRFEGVAGVTEIQQQKPLEELRVFYAHATLIEVRWGEVNATHN